MSELPIINIDNLPTKKELEIIFNELDNTDLSNVSFQKVLYTLVNRVKFFPIPTALIKKGASIERARINRNDEIFYSEKDLTYRTDFENIKNYGRVNVPGQSVFYGAIASETIDVPRVTILFEINELLRSADKVNEDEFVITVGKWRVTQDIEVPEMVFSKDSHGVSDLKAKYDFHMSYIKKDHPSRAEDLEFLLTYFSNQFAKSDINKGEDYKYKITNAIQAIFNAKGILYPSVRSSYHGYNIALNIETVEKFLQFEIAAMFRIYKVKDKVLIDNLGLAQDLGPLNSSFKWGKIEKTDEKTINQILFKN